MASLIAYDDGIEIFTSDGAWLYPLLELREHLQEHPARGTLTTYDRVVGRASALLSAGLGITEIKTEVLSERALPVLESFGIAITATKTESRILCATEDLLADANDPDEALRVVLGRIAMRRQDR